MRTRWCAGSKRSAARCATGWFCAPRFDYARASHRVERRGGDVLFVPETEVQPPLRLRSEVPMQVAEGAAVAEFTLGVNESAAFVLEMAGARDESPSDAPGYVAQRSRIP